MDDVSIRSRAEQLIQEFIDEANQLRVKKEPKTSDISFKIWKSRVAQSLNYYYSSASWQYLNFVGITFSDQEFYNGQYHYSPSKLKSALSNAIVLLEKIQPSFGNVAVIKERNLSQRKVAKPKSVFISHGRNEAWRELQHYLANDEKIVALELSQQPNRGRTVINKLNEVSDQCSFAVIVMTGDNLDIDGKPYARENVMHEIGFFQGKYGLDRVCILYETGTSIPTNLSGVVYVEFPKGVIKAAFSELLREIKAAFD